MKTLRISISLSLIVLTLLFSAGCMSILNSFNNDWEYDLVNGYTIFMANPRDITLVKFFENGWSEIIVDEYTAAFQYNDRYVGLKVQLNPKWEQNAHVPIFYEADFRFYLVDTVEDEVLGVFWTEGEYEAFLSGLDAGSMGEWIKTYPTPEGAVYG